MEKSNCPKYRLMCLLFLVNTIYGLASPFLPQVLEEKGVTSTWTGIIFASWAFSMVFTAPIVGKMLHKTGHAKMFVFGVSLMSSCCLCFGLIEKIESTASIIATSISLRML